MRTTVRRRFAIAAAGLVAVVATPLQSGVANASTPQEDLSACLASVSVNASADISDDVSDDITTAVDACVNTFLQQMGIDMAPATVDASTATVDTSAIDGSAGSASG